MHIHTYIPTYVQTDRQTYRGTDIQTDRHTYIYISDICMVANKALCAYAPQDW